MDSVFYDISVKKSIELDNRYPGHDQVEVINEYRDEFLNTLQERLNVYNAKRALADAEDILEEKKREYE